MKDKHKHVPEDSALLRLIYSRVKEEVVVNAGREKRLLVFKFIVYCSLAVLLYTRLYTAQGQAVFVACFVLYGFVSMLLAFNFAHDFSHNTIFKKRQWNNLGFTALYTLVGAHAHAWRQRHIDAHHYAPNVEHYDSDMQITSIIRVIPERRLAWYHRYQHMYAPVAYTSYSLFWIFIKDFALLLAKDGKKRPAGYYMAFLAQKSFYIVYLLLLPLLFAPQAWYIVLAGFLAMHLAQSLFLLFTFFITHHVESTLYPATDDNGYINCSWMMNQVKSSNDFYPFSKTANFIFGGFNNHIAHHLFPHVPSIRYPALNRILYRTLTEHGIVPNHTTYFGGIWSHLRLLRHMGR